VRHLWRNESGATIVEHAIMACAVALVVVALVASDLTPSRAFQGVGYIAESLFAGDDIPATSEPAGE
jgi:Flp pilus assembly pilin Flp